MAQPTWRTVKPAPLILLTGPEEYFAARAVDKLKTSYTKKADAEIVTLDATSYASGELSVHVSPSLFSAERLVIATDCHKATDDFVDDVLAYISGQINPEITLVIVHGGGNRGKSMLTAVKKHPDAAAIACAAVKKDSDKAQFVVAECRRLKRQISDDGVDALIGALGSDIRGLAAACDQLSSDLPDGQSITGAEVDRYYGGKIETTGFKVADAVVAGNTREALRLLRQAVATGVNPIPLNAALATRFRTLIMVGSAQSAGQGALKELGMAPWQVDRARKDLRRWSPDQLGHAMVTLADTDELLKGAGKDPVYALERAILSITGAG